MIRNINERKITPQHAFFALYLAAGAYTGVLNQGAMSMFARYVAPRLKLYLEGLGYKFPQSSGNDPVQVLDEIVTTLNEALSISDEVKVVREGEDKVSLIVLGNKCRYCPKGVGLAEIPGTLCPFPYLVAELAKLHGIELEILKRREGGRVSILSKEKGYCKTVFRLKK
ncbi:hypothetical protein PYJP_06850 [Pyrofollis japonicus]|nr:hypothetical protein PYJP_06850 [Pyrofollis japonicus]